MEAGTGTVLDKFLVSLIPDPPNQCLTCGDQSHLDGLICSCLDCFLSGGNLLLYEYNVSKAILIANFRAGTCTKTPSDSPDEVISRAKFLLSKNGFGLYDLLENNCEDFAVYCKTSLVVGKSYILGRSGQAGSVSVLSFVANMFSLWAGTAIRVLRDIGMRYDTIKLPVETLVARRNKCD
ncbi:unnamed protein product [Arabis nemorensis]|uniref:LRAT domain-containing protein n=1 Tax=Arabis nemorensis TaxID=586526 RepID=A0A565CMG0_9BRAS|nr:unnamed protein product [Arabis nemorensis]